MRKNPWKANWPGTNQKIPFILGNQNAHFHIYRQSPLTCTRWILPIISHQYGLRFISTLTSYLRLAPFSASFLQASHPQQRTHFCSFRCVQHTPSITPSLFDNLNHVCCGVQIMNIPFKHIFHPPTTFSSLGPNIFLRTRFSVISVTCGDFRYVIHGLLN